MNKASPSRHAVPPRAPLATRAEAAVPTPRRLIPDGCNLGVLLRTVLAATLATAAAAVGLHGNAAAALTAFVAALGLVAPSTLLTLLAWCVLRRLLPPAGARVQRALAWGVPAVIAATLMTLIGAFDDGQARPLGVALAALVAGAAVQYWHELRERAFSPAVAEARLQALQSRIRPHFLFNSLNAVLSVLRADPAKAERLLENLADLFRALMADTRRLVPLADELELCRHYVEIEQIRLGERLEVHWEIGAFHPKARVPQLLLQPILENAIRYGAEKQAGAADILVKVQQKGFALEIFVSNPIAPERPEREGNQMGLANIRGRLALIYDLEARIDTQIRRDRFELTMVLPVNHRE